MTARVEKSIRQLLLIDSKLDNLKFNVAMLVFRLTQDEN